MVLTVAILGFLLALTMKGEATVDTVRAVMSVYGIQQFQNRVYVYQAEYLAFPGDDERAPARFGRDQSVFMSDGGAFTLAGNGKIDGKLFDTLNPNGEQFMAWRDLRHAGMVEGDTALAGFSAMPENLFGGVYGFDEGNLGQQTTSLCLTRVPGRAAEIIDQRLDDGRINTGKVVATSKYDPVEAQNHFDTPDAEPYNIEKEYIICAPAMP